MATPGDSETAWSAGAGGAAPLPSAWGTAQVPVVGLHPQLATTGQVPLVEHRRHPVPLGLRLAVWGTALLVVSGLVVLGLDRAEPAWFKTQPTSASVSHGRSSSTSLARPPAGAAGASHRAGAVTKTTSDSSGATLEVNSAQYSVVVSAQAPCWVQVTTPGSSSPQFASVMAAGAQKTFHPSGGKLMVQLGASKVTVQVLLDAKSSSPAWQFTPTVVPYQLSFTSTTG